MSNQDTRQSRGFLAALLETAFATTEAAADYQRRTTPKRRKTKGKDCTPCAAQAYVDALRGNIQRQR